jgi:phage-related protein
VRDFLRSLSDGDYADVRAAMGDVADRGLQVARHLRSDIYEVRSTGDRVAYRVLFAAEGARGQVLLALEAFKKKTQKTPPVTVALAERRLRDWRSRARKEGS